MARVQSINDEAPDAGQLTLVQRKKIRNIIETTADINAALSIVTQYCKAKNKKFVSADFDNPEHPTAVIVSTPNTKYRFKFPVNK